MTHRYEHIISKPILDKDDEFKDYVNHDSLVFQPKLTYKFRVESSKVSKTVLAEPALFETVKKGDIIQIQRKSFYICDEKTESAMELIEIPDGSKQ